MAKVVRSGWKRSGKVGTPGMPIVDAIGFKGEGCHEATKDLREKLGTEHELVDKEERSEGFESETEGQTEQE